MLATSGQALALGGRRMTACATKTALVDVAAGQAGSRGGLKPRGARRRAPAVERGSRLARDVYYRLKRKQDGDREREIVPELAREKEAEKEQESKLPPP